MKQLIILTVPHYICKDLTTNPTLSKGNLDHPCDTYAGRLAETIADVLKSNERDIFILYGDLSRNVIDLNRDQGFITKFRNKVRQIISENKDNYHKIIYLIDCHSFPGGSFSNIRYPNPDVSILMADCRQLTIVEELTDLLKESGIKATKHLGRGNSIIEEFYGGNVVTILLEANENNSYDMTVVAQCINSWIEKVNKLSG